MTAKSEKTSNKIKKSATQTQSVGKKQINNKSPDNNNAQGAGSSLSGVLRKWNLRLGLVLVLAAVAVLVAGSSKTVELTVQYLATDTLSSQVAQQEVLAGATRHLADVGLAWIVAASLLSFAVAYLLAATVWRKRYETWLSRGVNKLRWAGLGVGGGFALVAVAMLSGVSDVAVLALIFGSVVLAGIFAASVELIGEGRRLRKLLAAGAIASIALPLVIFVANIWGAAMYGGSVPAYLYYIYASLALLLLAVGMALYFRIKRRGKWADTLYSEKMFMSLGFVAAIILAMQVFAGALQV